MNTQDRAAKKVKYTVSIIYLLVFAFIVGGTYINQQQGTSVETNAMEDKGIIWPEAN